MIYLARTDPLAIAIVEDSARARPYLARGYGRISREALSVLWSARDAARLAELTPQAETAPLARAVGAGR